MDPLRNRLNASGMTVCCPEIGAKLNYQAFVRERVQVIAPRALLVPAAFVAFLFLRGVM